MACFFAAVTLDMDTEEAHLRHSGDDPHGKNSFVELRGDERHTFFTHEFSDLVSDVSLFFTQKPF
jgi:hypothetical protein